LDHGKSAERNHGVSNLAADLIDHHALNGSNLPLVGADPNSEALMTLSTPAIPFFISSRSCLYGDYRSIAVSALAAWSPDLLGRAERSSPMPHGGAPKARA
jgi:hypothetical protein